MGDIRPASVMIVSGNADTRVGLSRSLTRLQWAPISVATWQRAADRGLAVSDVIVTDSLGLAAQGADLALLGIVAGWVPIIVICPATTLPRWAQHRVRLVQHNKVADHLEQFRLVRVSPLGEEGQ